VGILALLMSAFKSMSTRLDKTSVGGSVEHFARLCNMPTADNSVVTHRRDGQAPVRVYSRRRDACSLTDAFLMPVSVLFYDGLLVFVPHCESTPQAGQLHLRDSVSGYGTVERR